MLSTYLSGNATLFAKGCCIHLGMVFFVQRDFLQVLFAYLWFLHYYFYKERISILHEFRMHMFTRTIADAEGNSCIEM